MGTPAAELKMKGIALEHLSIDKLCTKKIYGESVSREVECILLTTEEVVPHIRVVTMISCNSPDHELVHLRWQTICMLPSTL